MDMIVLGKRIRGTSTREGAELFKLGNNVGRRTSGHAPARNKLRLEIRRMAEASELSSSGIAN